MGGAAMARPRKGTKPDPARRGPKTIGVRASAEWAEWVERGAKFCRVDMSKLVDISVVKYLREQGFDEPPPER